MKHKFEKYCKDYENIENYQKAKKDNFKGWNCHHRLETHTSDGKRRLVDISRNELKALDMYYNRHSEELIFLTISEHRSLHHKGKKLSAETRRKISKPKSDDTKKKMSEAHKGKHLSEETIKKRSEALKGHPVSEETKKKMSEANKGKKFSEEHKNKISLQRTGRHWYNDGKINKCCYECPDGFTPGRLLI